jgi:hypothetical protein
MAPLTDPFAPLQQVSPRESRTINSDLEEMMASARRTRANRLAKEQLTKSSDLALQVQLRKIAANDILDSANPTLEERGSFLSRVGNILDLPAKHIARPAMGLVLNSVFRAMPGEQEGEVALREAIGVNPFAVFDFLPQVGPERAEKVRAALKETDLPFGVHTAMEIALDPLTYVPVGGAIKVIKGGRQAIGLVAPKAPKVATRVGRLTPLAERIDEILPDNAWSRIGENASRIPVVREVVGIVNPGAAAKSAVGRDLTGYSQLLVDSEGLANVAVSNLAGRKFPFQMTKEGRIILKDGREEAWGDLLQRGGAGLDDPQKSFVTEYIKVLDEAKAYLDDMGIKTKDFGFAPGEHFIPRFVLGKGDIDKMTANIGRAVGSKPAFMKTRYYITMEEGLQAGINYANPLETLAQHLRGVYRTIADADLERAIRPLGRTTRLTDDQYLKERTIKSQAKRADKIVGIVAGAKTVALSKQAIIGLKRTDGKIGVPIGAAMEAAQKLPTRADRLKAIDAVLEDARLLVTQADAAKKAFADDLKKARSFARTRKVEEDWITQPGFAGRLFPKEVADEVNQFFKQRADRFAQAMADVNAVVRIGLVGADFGAGMIQGFPLLVRNPVAWVRAQTAAMAALADPKALARYTDTHIATIQEMAAHGGPVNINEFVEAGLRGGAAEKFLTGTGRPGAPFRFVVDRAAASFSTFGLAARVEWYEAMKPVVMRKVRKGGLTDSQALQQLTETVGKMTGVSGKAALSIGPNRAAWERGLLFAPTYLRSSLGLVADIFQGELRGELARESIAKLMASGTLFYFGWAAAMGQEPKLDPTKGDFLTVEIAGQRVGFGSVWVSLARFMGETYEQGERVIRGTTPASDLVTFDPDKSLLARFTRYKASPIAGLGWDMVRGRDPMGAPVGNPLAQPLEFTKDLPRYVLPFWAQQFVDDDSPIEGAERPEINTTAEIFGLKSFPTNVFSQRILRRDALAQASFSTDWEGLNGAQRRALNKQDEQLAFFDQQISAYGLESGDDLEKLVAQFSAKTDDIRKTRQERTQLAIEGWENGEMFGRQWRKTMKSIGAESRTLFQDINGPSSIFAPAIARIAEFRGDDRGRPIDDIAYTEYVHRIIQGVDELGPDGEERIMVNAFDEIDYDERDRRINDPAVGIRAKYGEEVFERILIRLRMGNELPPLVTEWHDGLELFRGYWEIGNQIADQQGIGEIWRQFKRNEGTAESDEAKARMPILVKINTQQNGIRLRMRQSSPALDAFLLKYGYTFTPYTPTVRRLGEANVQRSDFDVLALPID